MNIFFYCIIFTMGILFGSFYTLAVYRIPKKQDITHTHSYCPNCNAKLGFFELIPVFSYIFLGGKCKHCGKKIRPRYLILEVLSGLVFVLLALSLNLNVYTLTLTEAITFAFFCLYFACLFLIAGIDKEYVKVEKGVLYYGIIISLIYMVYLYILGQINIYRYVIYMLIFLALVLVMDNQEKKKSKNIYATSILTLIAIMSIFTGDIITISTIAVTIFAVALYIILKSIKKKNKEEKISGTISIAFFLSCINIIELLFSLFCEG